MKTYRKQPISPEAAYNKATTLCVRCEQAAAEVRTKLLNWGLGPSEADAVIMRLTDEGFLNEQRFARAFVNDKFRFNGWGRVKIAHQLHAEVLERFKKLNIAPYGGFVNPVLKPVVENGKITNITIDYTESYTEQILRYGREFGFL